MGPKYRCQLENKAPVKQEDKEVDAHMQVKDLLKIGSDFAKTLLALVDSHELNVRYSQAQKHDLPAQLPNNFKQKQQNLSK